jgi:hypothetical protein
MNNDLEQKQLQVIEAMRFPLIILVLFIHIRPMAYITLAWHFSAMNIYNIVAEMISHNVGSIAVPCFFLFSGFFFFYKKEELDTSFYFNQWRKRVRTLLIPYFIWNVLYILIILIKNITFSHLGLVIDNGYQMVYNNSLYNLLWSMPVNYPMWFLRDLIVMSLLAPLFALLFKYTKVYGLLFLFLIYVLGFDSNIPGFSMTAILFFGAGVYMAIFKKNILAVCSKWRLFTTVVAVFLLCISTYCNGTSYHLQLSRLFIPFGIICMVNFINIIISNEKLKRFLCSMSPTVFFIYAIHAIYIINWLKGGLYRTSLANSGLGMIICYILIPFIVLFICLVLYYLLRTTAPRLLSVLVGGRINNQRFNIARK